MASSQQWDAYARVQNALDRRSTVDDYAWGLEAAANGLLDGPPPDDIERTVRSGGRKERYRARLRRTFLRYAVAKTDPEREFFARERLRVIRALVRRKDWALLLGIAEGLGYAELAARWGVAPGTLRTRVSRLRASLRRAAA